MPSPLLWRSKDWQASTLNVMHSFGLKLPVSESEFSDSKRAYLALKTKYLQSCHLHIVWRSRSTYATQHRQKCSDPDLFHQPVRLFETVNPGNPTSDRFSSITGYVRLFFQVSTQTLYSKSLETLQRIAGNLLFLAVIFNNGHVKAGMLNDGVATGGFWVFIGKTTPHGQDL